MPTQFVKCLKDFPTLEKVFNPWHDVDRENDASVQSPRIRALQLTQYLTERVGRAQIILCAEALGYQGGHFSGIPMTSERILLGHAARKGIAADDVIVGGGKRTSLPALKSKGWTEPTATIVWSALSALGMDHREVVLWNAFAMHPMKGGMLTNRRPTSQELRVGAPLLKALLGLFPDARVIAVGDVAARTLASLGVQCGHVRHPANGGATKFREGIAALS